MRIRLSFPTVAVLAAAVALSAQAPQTQQRPRTTISEQPTLTAAQRLGHAPTDADLYCAGFFTRHAVPPQLIVLDGQEPGVKFEYSDRDIVYLNKGADIIQAPGAKFMLVRPMQDPDPVELFPGQHKVVKKLGERYAEIARIQVNIVHKQSSTAEILRSCQPVEAGELAAPLPQRPAPTPGRPRLIRKPGSRIDSRPRPEKPPA
jgi:hypothetical protein